MEAGVYSRPVWFRVVSDWRWLLGVVFAATLLRLWIFNGLRGHDDWVYLFYLRSVFNGQTEELLGSLWGLRWGVWVPVAVLFKVFGVHYELVFLPGFILGLLCFPLVYSAVLILGENAIAARCATLALLACPVDWFVSTTFRGDIEVSFFAALLLLGIAWIEANVHATPRKRTLVAILTGCAWGVAVLTKEWSYIFGWGFCAWIGLRAVRERRVPWVYLWTLLGLIAVVAADGVLLYCLTGNGAQRFERSITWYEEARRNGGYEKDLSLHYSYLPSLLLNLKNEVSQYGRYHNGYPLYGYFFYALFLAMAWVLARRGLWKAMAPAMVFGVGILLWMQFGSMSLTTYLPYHKEPRYLTVISVPVACCIGIVLGDVWERTGRLGRPLVGSLVAFLIAHTGLVLQAEHAQYVAPRDFMPQLVRWLDEHPTATVWTTATLQQEADLRFGYRFADPVHGHAGAAGFGSIQDIELCQELLPGEYAVVLDEDVVAGHPAFTPSDWIVVGVFQGRQSAARLCRRE